MCEGIQPGPTANCIGETGRALNTRNIDYQNEHEKATSVPLTRTNKEEPEQEGADITDHCKKNNHIMEWSGTKIIGPESSKQKMLDQGGARGRSTGTKGTMLVKTCQGKYTIFPCFPTILKYRAHTPCRPPIAGPLNSSLLSLTQSHLTTNLNHQSSCLRPCGLVHCFYKTISLQWKLNIFIVSRSVCPCTLKFQSVSLAGLLCFAFTFCLVLLKPAPQG